MNSLIECMICKKVFKQPVILPCFHNICKEHETEWSHANANKIRCPVCFQVHEIPLKGFPANLLAENLLVIKSKLDQLDLGPDHTVAKESCEYLRESIEELKRLRGSPEFKIAETVGKIRNKIDLHREEAKKKIDEDALKLIRELDEYEAKCKAELSDDKLALTSVTDDLIEYLERSLSEWKEELITFEGNVKTFEKIQLDSFDGVKKLRRESEKIKKHIFTNELEKLERKQMKFCGEKPDFLL